VVRGPVEADDGQADQDAADERSDHRVADDEGPVERRESG
jgi:hypothetical protein